MTLSPPNHGRPDTRYSGWLTAGRAQARIGPVQSLPVALPIVSPTIRVARAPPCDHLISAVTLVAPARVPIRKHRPVAKSP